jgi:putative SOS response-associated peptidase YedK
MCGRYTIGTDAGALEARFQAQGAASGVCPGYNAAPSQGLPTIRWCFSLVDVAFTQHIQTHSG